MVLHSNLAPQLHAVIERKLQASMNCYWRSWKRDADHCKATCHNSCSQHTMVYILYAHGQHLVHSPQCYILHKLVFEFICCPFKSAHMQHVKTAAVCTLTCCVFEMQTRSLASQTARQTEASGKPALTWFAADFREELSAFDGQLLVSVSLHNAALV